MICFLGFDIIEFSYMPQTKEKKIDFNIDLEEMSQAGLHFGHKTSKIHPRMMPFLAGVKNSIHLIDLEKTKEKLEEALSFIRQLILDNKILLIVGTKIQVKGLVEELTRELKLPYVTERWLGGTFTNFEIIKKRITYFKELERKEKEGELEKYTKRERIKINEELRDLEVKFGGIKNLERLPDAILVLDMQKDDLAVKEARMKGIKIVAISHTNTDPNLADYPIPANDDSISSVKYILDKIKEAILSAKLKPEKEKSQAKIKTK